MNSQAKTLFQDKLSSSWQLFCQSAFLSKTFHSKVISWNKNFAQVKPSYIWDFIINSFLFLLARTAEITYLTQNMDVLFS